MDGVDSGPVPYAAGPSLQMPFSGGLIDGMALLWGNETNGTVAVFGVVPDDEAVHSGSCRQ